jgi:hypothetical protein
MSSVGRKCKVGKEWSTVMNLRHGLPVIVLVVLLASAAAHGQELRDGAAKARSTPAEPTATPRGPLRVHPANPRYFTDGSGRAIVPTGSHTWGNFQDYT